MPRKPKEAEEIVAKEKKKAVAVKNVAKTEKTKATTKKEKIVEKKSASKKSAPAKKTVSTKKTTVVKKDSPVKKEKVKKAATKKKSTSKKVAATTFISTEYYDLPYRYNETTVKVLAQTPSTLFVYWDISDDTREHYRKTYGENFFTDTKPVLLIHNKTHQHSFEIEINDFANCWYLHGLDAKCEYLIELGRRPIENKISLPNNYLQVAYSNTIESPNNHILFEQDQDIVYYRNVKTNITTSKKMTTLSLLRRMGKIYNIYDLYQKIYRNEDLNYIDNPSSATSSTLLKERSK